MARTRSARVWCLSADRAALVSLDAATGQVVTRTPKIGLVADVAGSPTGEVYLVGTYGGYPAVWRVGTDGKLKLYAGNNWGGWPTGWMRRPQRGSCGFGTGWRRWTGPGSHLAITRP